MASIDPRGGQTQAQTRTETPPPRILPRNFSYNTFTPPPSTPTLTGQGESSHDPWARVSAAPSRTRTPDLAGSGESGARVGGYPIMDAVDPARQEETLGLMKDEDRGEGSRSRSRSRSSTRGRWSDEFSADGDLLSPVDSEDGASMMSAGVSRVKAAQAVWYVTSHSLLRVLLEPY